MADPAAAAVAPPAAARQDWASAAMRRRIRGRRRAERAFRAAGALGLALAAAFLLFLLSGIVARGWTAFLATEIEVVVALDAGALGVPASPRAAGPEILHADYAAAVRAAMERSGAPAALLSEGAWLRVRSAVLAEPDLIGRTVRFWLPAASAIDQLAKGNVDPDLPADRRPVSDTDIAAWKRLAADGRSRTVFNAAFLGAGDSVDPELAGVWGALKGSMLTLAVALALSFPVGILAAFWLEEFAGPSIWSDIVEVSIHNLAAAPPIIFGLLGLAIFLDLFGMERSVPLVGGLTLALMVLPIIIITARAAIRGVPPSIRDAALGLGATPVQMVCHHVLPLALPGMMAGTLFGLARALGEAAPLLMLGMRAFTTSVPTGVDQPATVLPVQIFLWSDMVARGFVEKTAGASIVLLGILLVVNGLAVHLRHRSGLRR